MERLKLRSPKLTFADEARWTAVRDAYCSKFRKAKKLWKGVNIGVVFVEEINVVLSELVEHYEGPTKFNTGGKTGGDPNAFHTYFRKMASSLPKPSTVVEL